MGLPRLQRAGQIPVLRWRGEFLVALRSPRARTRIGHAHCVPTSQGRARVPHVGRGLARHLRGPVCDRQGSRLRGHGSGHELSHGHRLFFHGLEVEQRGTFTSASLSHPYAGSAWKGLQIKDLGGLWPSSKAMPSRFYLTITTTTQVFTLFIYIARLSRVHYLRSVRGAGR